jgi:hypothetical protein
MYLFDEQYEAGVWPDQISEQDGPPPASELRWAGASDEQLRFMRAVYERHVARASGRRPFVGDVPADSLEEVEHGVKLRRPAAAFCRALLIAARADLASASANDARARTVSAIGISSGYRSASTQFASWQRNFPRYYNETSSQRASQEGGQHGTAAADLLARYIGGRLGAPGYSLHNNGLAVDFTTTQGGTRLGASTSAASISAWRSAWLFDWLSTHAPLYQFHQNTHINEPWHWEFRGPVVGEADPAEHDDEFYWYEDELPGEALNLAAGRAVVEQVPLLRSHKGTPPDLILRWNAMQSAHNLVDIVVHLHGYSNQGQAMRLDRDKEGWSGLDFSDPQNSAAVGRTRPTLGVLPRGNFFGGRSGKGYNFPALIAPTGLSQLIDLALAEFARTVGLAQVRRGRLIVTAHSGGGAALMGLLAHNDPDEVHVFDALYGPADALSRWATRRMQRDAALLTNASGDARGLLREQGGALRVLYRAGEGTAANSDAVRRALRKALPTDPQARELLNERYRVETTRVGHGAMPQAFGWQLLADAGATLPGVIGAAEALHDETDTLGEQLAGFSAAEEKALRITNAFENTSHYVATRNLSFGGLTGDFDRMGLSFGLLQWNIGSGSLQPLLREFARSHPERLAAIFGSAAPALQQMLEQPRPQQLAWARGINDYSNPRRPQIRAPWAGYFRQLADEPAFQAIQLRHVRPRMQRAAHYAREFGLHSERGLALMFDLVTQHGAAWPRVRERQELIQQRRAAFEQQMGRAPGEHELLAIIAEVVIDTVAPRWREAVRRRRQTLISGRGVVHGHSFALARDFGLSDAPLVATETWHAPLGEDNQALARSQWEAHTGVQRHFDGGFASYRELLPLYRARGIDNPAAYIAQNIVAVRFFERSTPAHRDLVGPLHAAEQALRQRGITPQITSFWSFVPRRIAGTTRLSHHAFGRAVDINPAANPHIKHEHDIRVIRAVTGVDLGTRQTASVMRAASQGFQTGFNEQAIAGWQQQLAQLRGTTSPEAQRQLAELQQVLAAVRARLSTLDGYARRGFLNLEQELIDELIAAGLAWGGNWERHKDFMHFELPQR